jgi:hypothetical protein
MGTSIAVLHVLVGVNFRKTEVWPSVCDVAVSWLRLQTPIDCIPYPYWMLDVYEVFEHLEMLWMGIWVHPYAFNTLCRWGWILGKIGYGRACMMLWCHG